MLPVVHGGSAAIFTEVRTKDTMSDQPTFFLCEYYCDQRFDLLSSLTDALDIELGRCKATMRIAVAWQTVWTVSK